MEVQILVYDDQLSATRPAPTATTDEGQTYALLEPGQKFQVQVQLQQSLTQSPNFRQQLKEYQARYTKKAISCELEIDGIHARDYLRAPAYTHVFKGHKAYSADRRIQGIKPFAARSVAALAEDAGLQEVKPDTGLILVKANFIEERSVVVPSTPTGSDLLEEHDGASLTAGKEKFGKKPSLSISLGKACDKALLTSNWVTWHNRKLVAEASVRIDSESAVAARHLQGGICLDAESQTRLKKYLRGPPAVINLIKQERHAHKKYNEWTMGTRSYGQ
ncbi:hypothetical protein WJX73_007603 [Symbiochloris irregularis]|uniref:Uncharacterized protein n=1 Tax=Symbiochloris irregularis TaxID=706552 RepID=A0AAW1PAU3_9CHLO